MCAGRSWKVSVRAGLKQYLKLRNETSKGKNRNRSLGWSLPLLMAGLVMLGGCDGGEKALDEVTGNRAVKQYHKSKKDVEKVTARQSERLKSIPDEEKE